MRTTKQVRPAYVILWKGGDIVQPVFAEDSALRSIGGILHGHFNIGLKILQRGTIFEEVR